MNDEKIPYHVGIIVDGNGRWAEERGLSRSAGHQAGAKNLDEVIDLVFKKGVKYLSIFVFSTENFKRSQTEVDFLMKLIKHKFTKDFKRFKRDQIKMVVSGEKKPLSEDIINIIEKITEETKDFTHRTLNICLNYGGQQEIVAASKKMYYDIINNEVDIDMIDEQKFHQYLYQDLPPIDLLIRTSGEQRISNFMLYQLAYAELYFPKIYFPDFDKEDLEKAIAVYNKRERRFGGYNDSKSHS